MRIDLNGGAVTVYSPPIPVRSLFSYVLEASLRTEGIKRDQVYISLTQYNEKNEVLETITSERHGNLPQWKKLRVGPIMSHSGARYAIIGLHLVNPARPDLKGHVLLDDVWFARLPRLLVKTDRPYNVYTDVDDIEITCEVSGIQESDPIIRFEMRDVLGKLVAKAEKKLQGNVVVDAALRGAKEKSRSTPLGGFAGQARWKPPVPDFGFYLVNVTTVGAKRKLHERQLTLAVVRPQAAPQRGEFDWTLPQGDDPLSFSALEELVSQAGINWLKFPVWYMPDDNARADQLVRFAERLSFHNIEIVGLLHAPPPQLGKQFGDDDRLAADLFSTDPGLWQPLLEPVMTRLSLKIVWWQLGLDQDASFVNYPNLAAKISGIKAQLYRFGQEVNVGVGWWWINEQLADEKPPWKFLSLSADPDLTAADVAAYLALDANRHAQTWVVLEPLPRGKYETQARAMDLIHRMLAAKIHEADTVFVPDPLNDDTGLMNADGSPGELFLPWRTTALALGGTEYVGSIPMPGGSTNHVFTRGGEAVIVIWNDRPGTKTLYLGEKL